jgi:hypothetical protein
MFHNELIVLIPLQGSCSLSHLPHQTNARRLHGGIPEVKWGDPLTLLIIGDFASLGGDEGRWPSGLWSRGFPSCMPPPFYKKLECPTKAPSRMILV